MQHHQLGSIKPAVNVVRPTIVGNGITVHTNNSSVLTSVLRPVMTTGVVNSGHQQRHQVAIQNLKRQFLNICLYF